MTINKYIKKFVSLEETQNISKTEMKIKQYKENKSSKPRH